MDWTGSAVGNQCKLDEIDALRMFHFANPDAVSFVLSQRWWMVMLVTAFAGNVALPTVASITFVHWQHFVMDDVLYRKME